MPWCEVVERNPIRNSEPEFWDRKGPRIVFLLRRVSAGCCLKLTSAERCQSCARLDDSVWLVGEEDWAEFLLAFCRDWLCCLCSVWTPESLPDGALQVSLASVCNKSWCWQEKSAREWLVNVKMCVICQRASGIESGASCGSRCPGEISGSCLRQIGYCVARFVALSFSLLKLYIFISISYMACSYWEQFCTIIFVESFGDTRDATNLEYNFMQMSHAVTTNESACCQILRQIRK